MRMNALFAAVLAAVAIICLARPASAESSGYSMAPAGPADPRVNFLPPIAAVFVVDNAKGHISMCFPDTKDGKWAITCTPWTKLP